MIRGGQEVDASAATFGELATVCGALALQAKELAAVGAALAAVRGVAHGIYAARITNECATGAGAGAIHARCRVGARVAALATVLGAAHEVDAKAALAGGHRVERVDPRRHAVDGGGVERIADWWHGRAAVAGTAKLGNEVRARGIAWNDADLSATKEGLVAEELHLELGGFEVEASGAVGGAVAAGVDAARLKDLHGYILEIAGARRARARLGRALSIATSTEKRRQCERQQKAKPHRSPLQRLATRKTHAQTGEKQQVCSMPSPRRRCRRGVKTRCAGSPLRWRRTGLLAATSGGGRR